MTLPRVEARRVAGREPVLDMPPVIGTGVGRIDAELLDRVDRLQHALDLGPAGEAQEDFAAGAHIATVEKASPGPIARRMSMRETTVP